MEYDFDDLLEYINSDEDNEEDYRFGDTKEEETV